MWFNLADPSFLRFHVHVMALRPASLAPRAGLARAALFALTLLTLSGCDEVTSKLGIEDAASKATRLENEGKAIGGACRQSGRAIEDCYSLYQWVPKASVYTGWREMDAYMRENRLDTITPELPPAPPPDDPRKKKKKKAAPTADGDAAAAAPTMPAPAQ